MISIKTNRQGSCLLNIGCGAVFSDEWTNIDFTPQPGVAFADIRKGLPFPDQSFEAVYHSHLLEHLSLAEGAKLTQETYRVLKPGGIIRIATPDLEKAAHDYLQYLSSAWANPSAVAEAQYRWTVMSFLDQLTREEPGGYLAQDLIRGDFDLIKNFIISQNGRELLPYFDRKTQKAPESLRQKIMKKGLGNLPIALLHRIKNIFSKPSARSTGEVHKWLYDKLSLKALLEKTGFQDFQITTFDHSSIPQWSSYHLDQSPKRPEAHKPDSIYVEARRP